VPRGGIGQSPGAGPQADATFEIVVQQDGQLGDAQDEVLRFGGAVQGDHPLLVDVSRGGDHQLVIAVDQVHRVGAAAAGVAGHGGHVGVAGMGAHFDVGVQSRAALRRHCANDVAVSNGIQIHVEHGGCAPGRGYAVVGFGDVAGGGEGDVVGPGVEQLVIITVTGIGVDQLVVAGDRDGGGKR